MEGPLRQMGKTGVVTGGQNNNHQTCIPYFADGNSLDHFKNNGGGSPTCPTKCYSTSYPRSFNDDLFIPTEWANDWPRGPRLDHRLARRNVIAQATRAASTTTFSFPRSGPTTGPGGPGWITDLPDEML